MARSSPTVKAAAESLGITRRHLSRLLHGETRRTRCLARTWTDRETPTDEDSLTYADATAHIHVVPTTQTHQADEVVSVTLDLPKACVEWLELAAVRWKHRTGARHPAKSPVVADLIRAAMKQQ